MNDLYKIVTVECDEFSNPSYYSLFTDNDNRIEYRIGEFVYPKLQDSKIYVFDDIKKALIYIDSSFDFQGIYDSIQLFRCSTTGPIYKGREYYPRIGNYREIWKHINNGTLYYSCYNSILCSSCVVVDNLRLDEELSISEQFSILDKTRG